MGIPHQSDAFGATWVAGVLFLAFVGLAWVNMNAPKQWRLMARSALQLRLGRQVLREELDLQDRGLLALLIVALTVVGLFLLQAGAEFQGLVFSLTAYGKVLLAALAIVLAQVVLLRLLSFLFQGDQGATEFLYTGLVLLAGVALLLLPLILLAAYQPSVRREVLLAGTALLALALLFRWLRGLVIGVGEHIPVRYILLYLCAAEMLPALLATRLL